MSYGRGVDLMAAALFHYALALAPTAMPRCVHRASSFVRLLAATRADQWEADVHGRKFITAGRVHRLTKPFDVSRVLALTDFGVAALLTEKTVHQALLPRPICLGISKRRKSGSVPR